MANQKSNTTNNFENIKFVYQSQDAYKIFLFKSEENANSVKNKIISDEGYEKLSIGVIESENEEVFTAAVNSLLDAHRWVILMNDDDNFTTKEIIKIGLAVKKNICVCKEHDYDSWNDLWSLASISTGIGDPIKKVVGKKYSVSAHYPVMLDGVIFSHKNTFIKAFRDPKIYGDTVFSILTNYSFSIKKIIIDVDNNMAQELVLEIVDYEGNKIEVNLPSKDKHSLANFRKIICPLGRFIDGMSDADFKQILKQLYVDNGYSYTYQHNHPGLLPEQNVWLLADEVISLED